MEENLKLEPWGNHNYKGSKQEQKTKSEIMEFEDGSPINCSEIPNYCKEFPDTCMCRTIRFAKQNDVKGSQMLFEPEKTGYSGSKPWLLEELKGFESAR